MLRRDSAEPTVIMSSSDIDDPSRVTPTTENAEPTRIMQRKDIAEPI